MAGSGWPPSYTCYRSPDFCLCPSVPGACKSFILGPPSAPLLSRISLPPPPGLPGWHRCSQEGEGTLAWGSQEVCSRVETGAYGSCHEKYKFTFPPSKNLNIPKTPSYLWPRSLQFPIHRQPLYIFSEKILRVHKCVCIPPFLFRQKYTISNIPHLAFAFVNNIS